MTELISLLGWSLYVGPMTILGICIIMTEKDAHY